MADNIFGKLYLVAILSFLGYLVSLNNVMLNIVAVLGSAYIGLEIARKINWGNLLSKEQASLGGLFLSAGLLVTDLITKYFVTPLELFGFSLYIVSMAILAIVGVLLVVKFIGNGK